MPSARGIQNSFIFSTLRFLPCLPHWFILVPLVFTVDTFAVKRSGARARVLSHLCLSLFVFVSRRRHTGWHFRNFFGIEVSRARVRRDSRVRLFVKRDTPPSATYNHFRHSLRSNNEALYPLIASSVFSFPGSHLRLAFIANFNEETIYLRGKVEILVVVERLIGKYYMRDILGTNLLGNI